MCHVGTKACTKVNSSARLTCRRGTANLKQTLFKCCILFKQHWCICVQARDWKMDWCSVGSDMVTAVICCCEESAECEKEVVDLAGALWHWGMDG